MGNILTFIFENLNKKNEEKEDIGCNDIKIDIEDSSDIDYSSDEYNIEF
tara:strand:+ start:205 stop:351 length:147 start_codon:yes stop_codon:yes gene_type:complete